MDHRLPMNFSLGYLSLPGAGAGEVVEAAAAAGFNRVGMRIGGRLPTDSGEWLIGNPAGLRDVRSRLAGTGVTVANVAAHYVGPSTSVSDFMPVLDVAATLGCDTLCVSGYIDEEREMADRMAELAQAAAPFDIRLALEFVPYSRVRTLAAALRVLDGLPCRRAGILLDMMHFMRSGGRVGDLDNVDPERIVFVQICDGAATSPPADQFAQEARTGRLFVCEGAFPIRQILASVPTPYLEIEIPHRDMAGLSPPEMAKCLANRTKAYFSRKTGQVMSQAPPPPSV
jgi:sugar phosphate isomerase/epimerase